jgi:hypothetical protein
VIEKIEGENGLGIDTKQSVLNIYRKLHVLIGIKTTGNRYCIHSVALQLDNKG